jgi:nitroimidazol reductase NimA-like FMN-containing flavoprotein (pyridoxamine 5'-phosphate oxidase superfamily)
MSTADPTPELDPRYSTPDAGATSWEEARDVLIRADLYWIATVRPSGQPHVTPLLAVWADGAMHVSTGHDERKARNLAASPRCTLTTGRNTMEDGLDVVVEGEAVRVTRRDRLAALRDMWVAKYGETWRFDVSDDGFHHPNQDELDPGVAALSLVFALRPARAYAFRKGAVFSQTRYRFRG